MEARGRGIGIRNVAEPVLGAEFLRDLGVDGGEGLLPFDLKHAATGFASDLDENLAAVDVFLLVTARHRHRDIRRHRPESRRVRRSRHGRRGRIRRTGAVRL